MNILTFIVTLILVTIVLGVGVGMLANKYLEDFYNKGKEKRNRKSENNCNNNSITKNRKE